MGPTIICEPPEEGMLPAFQEWFDHEQDNLVDDGAYAEEAQVDPLLFVEE